MQLTFLLFGLIAYDISAGAARLVVAIYGLQLYTVFTQAIMYDLNYPHM